LLGKPILTTPSAQQAPASTTQPDQVSQPTPNGGSTMPQPVGQPSTSSAPGATSAAGAANSPPTQSPAPMSYGASGASGAATAAPNDLLNQVGPITATTAEQQAQPPAPSATAPDMTAGFTSGAAPSGQQVVAGPLGPSSSIVRLRDVARTELGALNYNQFCTF